MNIESKDKIQVEINNGISFNVGDKVNFINGGAITIREKWNGKKFIELKEPEDIYLKPVKGTYVWAKLDHLMTRYVIQHPNGLSKEHFIKDYLKGNFRDGFEAVHSSQLKDGLKYIWVSANELELVKAKTNNKETKKIEPEKKSNQDGIGINISQSVLKEIWDYANKELCGLRFEAQYIKKIPFPSSSVQKLGLWFEYMCTGALPRDGKVPEPERKKDKIEIVKIKGKKLKKGGRAKDKIIKKTIKGELTAPYERMKIQSERFKKTIKKYGIKIIGTQVELKFENKKGVLDALIEFEGKKAILDIKSSGLIGDKWNSLGWEIESLPEKDKITIQPLFYKWLWRKLYNEDIPFYFLVFSNTNEYECLFLEIIVDEEAINRFGDQLKNVESILQKEIAKGFKAYPSVAACYDCPIKSDCKSYTDIPLLQKIYVA